MRGKKNKAGWRNKKQVFEKFEFFNHQMQQIKELHEAIKKSLVK